MTAAHRNAVLSHDEKGAPVAHCDFISFDGGVQAKGTLQRPDRYRFWGRRTTDDYSIARGAGLSYAASSFYRGGNSVALGAFNRILNFDAKSRIVEVEAGIELFALHNFLAKNGLFLPIQPGHGRITIGGCVAADVHGKNQARDGTFIKQVVGLTLFHPTQGLIELSPEIETDIFRLTCGGYGLTGHILRVKLRAASIPSDTIQLRAVQIRNAGEGVDNLALEALNADFAYTWHDCMKRKSHFGRGFLFLANFTSETDLSPHSISKKRSVAPMLSALIRKQFRLPLLNCFTAQLVNFAYYEKRKIQGIFRQERLEHALFPIHASQTYFKLFGAKGFHEYQAVLPSEHIHEYLDAVKKYQLHRPMAITLASAKLFSGPTDLLRFCGEGTCFALNFPRTSTSGDFMAFLDDLVVSLKGRPNIIKDSRLPKLVVDTCYPEADIFREKLRAFDPKRLFRSDLSERLGL